MPPMTYANYLDLEKLFTLPKPRSTSPEHGAGVGATTGALPT
jgi:tryptophan 2,3-dioxygenase